MIVKERRFISKCGKEISCTQQLGEIHIWINTDQEVLHMDLETVVAFRNSLNKEIKKLKAF